MARGDYPSAKQDQYMLRFPEGMRDEIKTSADLNGRSMNAEIIQRLRQSYSHHEDDRHVILVDDTVYFDLKADAYAQNKSVDQRAADILGGAYDFEFEYVKVLDRLKEEVGLRAELEDQINELKKQLERDFVLYYTKATQLNQLSSMILETDDQISSHVREAAARTKALTEVEITLLQRRYEDGKFWISRRDIERENARDAASEGATNEP